MADQLIAFCYYGGKNTHVNWLVPLLPYDTKYIEPFCGSAAVLLNRLRSPMEVINDKNKRVINFFKVLRDHREEFVDNLRLTPYSKEEHESSIMISDDPIEDARRFFIFARQSYLGQARTWAISPKEIRTGFSQVVKRWLGAIEGLIPVIDRLRKVSLENRDALDIIPRYDSEDTVFYCDPPYYPETRTSNSEYTYEMNKQEHKELLNIICNCEGKVAISGYDNDLYNERLSDWYKFVDKEKGLAGPRGKRQEILWSNYDYRVVTEQYQTTLYDHQFTDDTSKEVIKKNE